MKLLPHRCGIWLAEKAGTLYGREIERQQFVAPILAHYSATRTAILAPLAQAFWNRAPFLLLLSVPGALWRITDLYLVTAVQIIRSEGVRFYWLTSRARGLLLRVGLRAIRLTVRVCFNQWLAIPPAKN